MILLLKMQIKRCRRASRIETATQTSNQNQSSLLFWPARHFIRFIICGEKGIYLNSSLNMCHWCFIYLSGPENTQSCKC